MTPENRDEGNKAKACPNEVDPTIKAPNPKAGEKPVTRRPDGKSPWAAEMSDLLNR